jgi:chemotaxis protein MotA
MGVLAPAWGMIGTLIGLVQMLQNLADPSSIGPAMAVALLTTFYGALLANLVFFPASVKLSQRSKEEALIKEIIIEGVISIAQQENPNTVQDKLDVYLSPSGKPKEK